MFSYKTFFSMHRVGKIPDLARGYAFPVDDWMRLDRFLILGSEGGTYYAGGRPLARQNTDATMTVIKKDGERAVARIAVVSQSGRAPKNDAAVFALALAATFGNERTKRAIIAAIPKVCRTGADLFQFADWVEGFGGDVRALRRGLAAWYTEQSADQLALQLVTHRQRGARSHRDLLKLCRASTSDAARKALFDWVSRDKQSASLPETAAAFVSARKAKDASEVAALIVKHGLPREAVPAEWLKDSEGLARIPWAHAVPGTHRQAGHAFGGRCAEARRWAAGCTVGSPRRRPDQEGGRASACDPVSAEGLCQRAGRKGGAHLGARAGDHRCAERSFRQGFRDCRANWQAHSSRARHIRLDGFWRDCRNIAFADGSGGGDGARNRRDGGECPYPGVHGSRRHPRFAGNDLADTAAAHARHAA